MDNQFDVLSHSASFWPDEMRWVSSAVLHHVGVEWHGVESWVGDSVVTKELAVVGVWVGVDAGLWSLWLGFEDVHEVDILWSEFSRVDDQVAEDATFHVHLGDEWAAGSGDTIMVVTVIDEAVFLDKRGNLHDGHVLEAGKVRDLREVLA